MTRERIPKFFTNILSLLLLSFLVNFNAFANTIWEVKVGAGLTSQSISKSTIKTELENAAGITFDSLSFNESSSNYSVSLLFRLEDQVFIETGYQSLGDNKLKITGNILDPTVIEAGLLEFGPGGGDGYYLGGGYEHQIGQKLWVSINGGLYDWESQVSANISSLANNVSVKVSGTDPYFGFGIVYKWYADSAIYLDFKKFSLNQNSPITASLGFSIRF